MKAALATILFLVCCVCALAQDATDKTYRIHVDDVLRIQLYGEQQVNVDVPVGQDGNIVAPFVGTVKAEGRTTSEVEAELTKAYQLKLRLRDPKVSVGFAQIHPTRAFVGGAVRNPGQYLFRPGDTILSLLHQAGDPVIDGADLRRSILYRKDSPEGIPIDLYSMLRRGDLSQNYELQEGDKLEVPVDTTSQIKVLGYVQRPGLYPFREPMTLADVISAAGGEIPNRSMMSQTRIIREVPGAPGSFQEIRPNIVNYWSKGDATQNVELRAGDLVYVPATKTPDFAMISSMVNSAFFIDSLFRNGLFGFRFFR